MEVAEKASWEGWPTEGKTMGFGKSQCNKDQCILFHVVFTPSQPATTAVFGSYLSSLYS
jgi:hypothetical protein